MGQYTVQVEEDESGEMILDLGPLEDAIKELGWKIGDTVEWINNKDGTWSLRKVE